MEKIKKTESGFTIIESLVVIFVLSLALIPIVSTTLSSMDLSDSIKNTFISAQLVQEGIEVTRGIRDKNSFTNASYTAGLLDCGTAICQWRVQWDSDSTMIIDVGNPNIPLKFDSATGRYNYAIGINTIFTRTISITDGNPVNPNKDLRIISTVSWTSRKGVAKSISAESHLFDYR